MKKLILIVLCLFLTVGCTKKDDIVNSNIEEDKPEVPQVEDTYIDDNPIKVGLYMNGKLINEYNTKIVDGEDIASFDVYFTDIEDVGSSNTKNNFNKYYQMYDDIDNYKIGFYISFDTEEKKMESVILNPSSMYDLYYIYNYLYDDIHQPDGAWYSHVEEKDVTDNTIYSSIKLYAGGETSKITSPITLMVFTYDGDDDFDSEGHYRGVSSHTLIINNK